MQPMYCSEPPSRTLGKGCPGSWLTPPGSGALSVQLPAVRSRCLPHGSRAREHGERGRVAGRSLTTAALAPSPGLQAAGEETLARETQLTACPTLFWRRCQPLPRPPSPRKALPRLQETRLRDGRGGNAGRAPRLFHHCRGRRGRGQPGPEASSQPASGCQGARTTPAASRARLERACATSRAGKSPDTDWRLAGPGTKYRYIIGTLQKG